MNTYNSALGASITLAALLTLSTPAAAATSNLILVQPSAIPHGETLAQADQAQPPAASDEQPKATTTHHKKHPVKHHGKKKPAHNKTSSVTGKSHKKATAHATHKAKSKVAAHHPRKNAEPQHVATVPTRTAKAKREAPDASTAALTGLRAPVPVKTAAAGKTVTYDFCLGYDNCVPHRFEATMAGGRTSAKVQAQNAEGNWTEASLDPVMMADLNKLAQAEPQSRTERALTPDEKEVIADHQGKMHATLVSEVESGSTQKEQVKKLMRELNIQNMKDLDAYDPRLGRQDVAVQAVNEISVGR